MEFLEAIDRGAAPAFRVVFLPRLLPLYWAVHYLGHPLVLLGVLVLAVLVFLSHKQPRPALLLIGTALVAVALQFAIQVLVDRARPNEGWAERYIQAPTSPGFPSAHALGATILYGTLGALLARRRGRSWPLLVGAALAFLAGVVQLLIAHNFVSDVLAGWAAGAILAMICVSLDRPTQSASTGAIAP